MPAMASAEYIVCYPNVASNDALFKAAPKLKLYQLLSAGYDDVDIEAARRARVPVCNNGGANAISVSEHAMMLMLTVSRRVVWQHESVSAGRWRGNGAAPMMYEIYDKTLGIVGLGTIGKKVARLANASGCACNITTSRGCPSTRRMRSASASGCSANCCAPPTSSPCTCRSTTSTRHMIGADELALMKPEAIIVNTSRGPVIDEVALTKALADNKLFGAGLDVFDQEPPPPDNPIFKLRNVVLTSHFAGPTWDNHVARFRNAFDNVQRVASRRKADLGRAGTG